MHENKLSFRFQSKQSLFRIIENLLKFFNSRLFKMYLKSYLFAHSFADDGKGRDAIDILSRSAFSTEPSSPKCFVRFFRRFNKQRSVEDRFSFFLKYAILFRTMTALKALCFSSTSSSVMETLLDAMGDDYLD